MIPPPQTMTVRGERIAQLLPASALPATTVAGILDCSWLLIMAAAAMHRSGRA